jgi:hypothetical protein
VVLQLVAEEVGSRLAPPLPWLRALGRCAGRVSCIETHFMPPVIPSPAVCLVVDVRASREESRCFRRGCRGRKRECRWTTIAAIGSALHRVAENGNHFKSVHVTAGNLTSKRLNVTSLSAFPSLQLTSPSFNFACTAPRLRTNMVLLMPDHLCEHIRLTPVLEGFTHQPPTPPFRPTKKSIFLTPFIILIIN